MKIGRTRTARPRIAIVTAIVGRVDDLKRVPPQSVPVDKFCFTDRKPWSQGWIVLPAQSWPGTGPPHVVDNMRAKYYKLQTHRVAELKNYEHLVWIDGSISIESRTFVEDLVRCAGEALAMFRHPQRSCAYAEAAFSLTVPRYAGERFADQTATYRAEGFPENYGLWANTIFARRNCGRMNELFDDYWAEVERWGVQCQVSGPRVFWRHGFKPNEFPGDLYRNQYVAKRKHSEGYEKLKKKGRAPAEES